MKQKLSISIDNETVIKLEELIKEGRFRNKSHILEYSFKRFIENE